MALVEPGDAPSDTRSGSQADKDSELPSWFQSVFRVFNDFLSAWEDHRDATTVLIGSSEGLARLAGVLGKDGDHVARLEKVEEAARKESERGLPFLHGQGIVLAWAALETFVQDVVTAALVADPELLLDEKVRRVKVSAGEFLDMGNDEERIGWLVRQMERSAGSESKAGVTRFETLLAFAGLSGPFRPELRDGLYELQQYRNLIAHKGGRIDAAFLDKCPWVDEDLGAQLRIEAPKYMALLRFAVDYACRVEARVAEKYGGSPRRGWEDPALDPWSVDG
ncbi:MAG: hypothetical protein GY701_25495 [Sulfitobacter sp.]|nr:hypothetical protein [Sulfitobacter sp.]